jgi:hypothetical protein
MRRRSSDAIPCTRQSADDALQNIRRTDGMASGGKKKTTMAKLNRESRLRERRAEKDARKRARKEHAAFLASQPEGYVEEFATEEDGQGDTADAGEPVVASAPQDAAG